MPTYRLYRLDGAGKIASAEWVEANSDRDALATVRDHGGSERFELWERNRLVGDHSSGAASPG